MQLFLSQYINNVDKKGRISVPSIYRSVLVKQDFAGMILYPSIKHQCLEGCSMQRLIHTSQIIESLDPYSDERDAFEAVVMAESVQLAFDNEGRVLLPKQLLDYAGISRKACFVGKGKIFEIWDPEKFNLYLVEAKKLAHANRSMLKNI